MEMLETLRRGYEAFSRGDMSAVAGLATRDVEWGTTGAFAGIDGLYRGPEVIQQWADAIHSDWGDVEVSLDEVLHDGGDVVVVAERLRGRDRARGEMTLRSASTPRTGSRMGRSEGARRAPRARSPSKPPGCRSSADGAGFFLTGLRLALTFSRLAPSPVRIARSSRSTFMALASAKGAMSGFSSRAARYWAGDVAGERGSGSVLVRALEPRRPGLFDG